MEKEVIQETAKTLFQKIVDWINGNSEKLVSFTLEQFQKLDGLIQALILVGGAILVVIGALAVIKKSMKLIIILAIAALVFFAVWTYCPDLVNKIFNK